MSPQVQLPVPNPSDKPRELTVGYIPLVRPGTYVPYLRLRGRWLNDAGFAIGQRVKVDVNEGRITIEVCAAHSD